MFDIAASLRLYLDNCRANGFSPATASSYSGVVSQYAKFCENKKQSPILPASVAAYKAYMVNERGVKLGTVQYHIVILRGFFAYCLHTLRTVPENPVLASMDIGKKQLSAERKPYGEKLMTEQEIKLLVTSEKPRYSHERLLLRNRAIVLLFVLSGLRNTELRTLSPKDLDFDAAQILVRFGKGGKTRYVPFPRAARDAVNAYLASDIRPASLPDTAPLFGVGKTAEDWHVMDRFSMSTLVKRYVASATGHDGERSHALRHAYASTLLTNGVPIQNIQQTLGHSSIRTTERYAAMLAPRRASEDTTALMDSLFA